MQKPDHSLNRVIIEDVTPQVDGGRHPVRRIAGDKITVTAAVFADGHDQLATRVLYRPDREESWRVVPMQAIGNGVFELKAADEAAWYRVIYLSRIEDTIYVLDSFTKKTRKTEKNDLNRAKARLSQVRQRLQEARTDAKRTSNQ